MTLCLENIKLIDHEFTKSKTQRQISKTGLAKSIARAIVHANFELFRIYPAPGFWKNRQRMANI